MDPRTIDRRAYYSVKKHYPGILKELCPPQYLNSPDEVPQLFEKYKWITSSTDFDVRKDRNDSLLLFISVINMMDDQDFFSFDDQMGHKIRAALVKTLNRNPAIISRSIKKARTRVRVDPQFTKRLNELYEKMIE